MIATHWQLQEAKNKFSKLVNNAEHTGPQIVTKHGKDAVVILAINEYRKLIKPKKNLVQFFQSSPLATEELNLARAKDIPRNIDL